MAQTRNQNETIDGVEARSCRGNEERKFACPCGTNCDCPKKARWLGLALMISGLGFAAFRTARCWSPGRTRPER